MDESVREAMAKWPNVPALYGWVGLDEEGHWRLRGEPITHPGLIAFIDRNYDQDEHGAWFFQNGPQRGYVHLAYTPWIIHADSEGALATHTEARVERIDSAYIDEDGNLIVATEHGPGLVDSEALAVVADWLRAGDGPADLEALEAIARGEARTVALAYGGHEVPVCAIRREEVPARFGYVRDPATAASA